MAVDLKWDDACSASRAFTAEEKAAGWPASVTPAQLAALQRPWELTDKAARARCWALQRSVHKACEDGDLPSEAHTVLQPSTVRPRVRRDPFVSYSGSMFGSNEWTARDFGRNLREAAAMVPDVEPPKAVTVYRIAPAAAARWLHDQGETPSGHMLGWFAARAVPWPPLAVVPPMPTDWPSLVQYRKDNPGTDWGLGAQLAILGDRLQELMGEGMGKTAAFDAMADEIGPSRQGLQKAMDAERKRPKAVAAPPGVIVRSGRKTG